MNKNISIEDKLQEKLLNAESFQHSQEQRNALWTEINSKSASVAGTATQKTLIETKYFINVFSKKSILYTSAGVITGILMYFGISNMTEINAPNNTNVEKIITSESTIDQSRIEDNSAQLEAAEISNYSFSETEKNVVEKQIIAVENKPLTNNNITPNKELASLTEESEQIVNAGHSTKSEKFASEIKKQASEPKVLPLDEGKNLKGQSTFSIEKLKSENGETILYEDSATVYVKKPVILENKEVKVIKERSKYSKRVKSKK